MKIVSWNVNGLRAVAKRGYLDWLGASGADIVGLQEVRAHPDQIPPEVRSPAGWHVHYVTAKKRGYSGVGLIARQAPDSIETSLGVVEHDEEGRLQIARFGALTVVNGYFPNGSGTGRDNSRIPFKLDFYRRLFAKLEPLVHRGERLVVMGDFNTAHREIDLARPKQNAQTSGFCPEERAELDRWLQSGWTDTFRHFEPAGGHYSWWSQRFGVREKNIGWRIDYVLASPAAMSFVTGAFIDAHVQGSDHCPIGVRLDRGVLR